MFREGSGDRKGGGGGGCGVRAYYGVVAVKTCVLWVQLKVEMRTRLRKGSEAGLGLGGWSEVRSHPRTGQDRGEAAGGESKVWT